MRLKQSKGVQDFNRALAINPTLFQVRMRVDLSLRREKTSVKQESPPGSRKRHTACDITCPR